MQKFLEWSSEGRERVEKEEPQGNQRQQQNSSTESLRSLICSRQGNCSTILNGKGKSWRFSSCSSSDGSPRASLDSSSHPTIYTYCILERASYTFFPRLPLIRDSSLLKRRTFDSRIECVSEREKESRETDITIYSFFSCRARIMTLFPYNPLIALKQANEHTRTEMKFMFSCETSSRTRGLVLCRDNFPLWDDNQLIRENNCRFQTIINRT